MVQSQPATGPEAAAALPQRRIVPSHAVVLGAVVTLVFLMFVLTEPTQRWLLLLAVVVTAFGTDGVLRGGLPRTFALGLDTTPQLVLPALYALAIPLFIEENVRGFWSPICAIVAGLGLGLIVLAEAHSVREFERRADAARLVADGASYLTAFALFSLIAAADPGLAAAVAAAALVAGLLSIELLRDASLDLPHVLTFAVAAALISGELRWALHFVPLSGQLVAVVLLLALFFSGGVLAARLRGHLTLELLLQYAVLTALGLATVVAASAAGLA